MATVEDENVVDTEENEKVDTPHLDTNESVSMPMSNANTVTGPSTKRRKSVVWNHFEPIYVNDQRRFAKCNHCHKQMTGRPNDGTSHLKDHIQKCPRRISKDIRQQILVQDQTTKDGKTAVLSNYKFDAEQSREDIANMIIIHDYPLSVVEHYGFRKYSNGLEPSFKVPCRATIKSDIMKIYEKKRVPFYHGWKRTKAGLLSLRICGQRVNKTKVTWQ